MWDSLSINLALALALLVAVAALAIVGLWVIREDRPVAAVASVTEPAIVPRSYARPASGEWWSSMRRHLWAAGFAGAFLFFTAQNAFAQTSTAPTQETIVELLLKHGGPAALAAVFASLWAREVKASGEYRVQEEARRRAETEMARERDRQEAITRLGEKDQVIQQLTSLHEKTIKALGDLNTNVGGINQMMAEDRRQGGDRRTNAR